VVLASAVFGTLLFIANYMYAGILCFAAFIGAVVFSRDIVAVIWSLVYAPAGWIMFQGVTKKMTRTLITVRIAVFAGIVYSALIIGVVAAENGAVSPMIIYQAAEAEIEAIVENFQDILLDTYVPADMSGDEEEQARNRELLQQEYIMNLKMMIPMFFVLYSLAIAYFSTALFRIIYNIFIGARAVSGRFIKRIEWRIKLSVVSAVMIILCSVFNLLLYSRDNPLPSIIISNIQYILAPGFCIMGIYFLFDKTYNMYNRHREIESRVAPAVMLLLTCVFAIILLQYTAIAILVICGLYAALIGDIKKFYEKTKKAVFGDDDDDDM
jgi:hypothetical protein